MPIAWDQGHTSIPLAVPRFPLRHGYTPRLEVTSTYALTKSGRYHPRPTEKQSQEEVNWLRVEKENRDDFRRESSKPEPTAPSVKAKAMPVSSVGTTGPAGAGDGDGPAPFDTWEGPWSDKECALWKNMSRAERAKWNKRWKEWRAAKSAVAFAQGVVDVDPPEGEQSIPESSEKTVPEPKGSEEAPESEGSKVGIEKSMAVEKEAVVQPSGVREDPSLVRGDEVREVPSSVRGDQSEMGSRRQSERDQSEKGSRRRRRHRRRRSPSSYSSSPERRRRRRSDKAEMWIPPPPWFPAWHLPPPHGAVPKVGPPLDQFRARGLPTPPPAPNS